MRFMFMHKVTDKMEQGILPSPEEMEAIGAMMGEAAAAGVFFGGEGLKPTSTRKHLRYAGGVRTVTDGPFAGGTELPAGFALLRVGSMDEAIGWCDRFAAALGDVDLYLGPVVENWDLGFGEKPADAPLRVLAMHRMDAAAEADLPPSPAQMARMGALMEEMTRAGVLEATAGLASTRHGARIRFEGGRSTVIDGPFAESKELVAGYAIFELPSLAEAIPWALKFGEAVGITEIDIRRVHEAPPA